MDKLTFALAYMANVVKAPKKDERGATAVEYGLLVALIAAIIIVAVALLGTNLSDTFDSVADRVGGATGGAEADTDG